MKEAPRTTFPTDPAQAIEEWRNAALVADELRIDLDSATAHAYLTMPAAEGQKTTEGQRDAYATAQTADLRRAAARAYTEQKACWVWMEFRLRPEPPK